MRQDYPRLLGDVGGTNARWAWQTTANGPLQNIHVSRCSESASLFESAAHYLQQHGLSQPRAASIGIATAVTGDHIQFTNNAWSFSVAALKKALQVQECLVINDFTALAMSLPALAAADLKPLGTGIAVANTAIGLLGPGTGLGVSGLMPDKIGNYSAISGEGGHVTLAPTDDFESAVLTQMRTQFAHVSAERILSGPGLVNLFQAICKVEGVVAKDLRPQDVSQNAISGADTQCMTTVRLFSSFLGNVAGNLALTLGATGGVYIGGGVVAQLGSAFDADLFRQRFNSKGRFTDYLVKIPVWQITAATPALLGASRALDVLKP
jgi:glucokinase